MDLSQALQDLVQLARKSQEVAFTRPPNGPPDQFYLCRPGETPELVTAEPAPRRVRCGSVDGFVQAVTRLHEGVEGDVVVYVGAAMVHAYLREFGDRRDTVSMMLTETDQLKAVREMVERPVVQDDLVWMLRSTLAGCCTHAQFPTMVRKLKITNNEDGQRSVGVGRESIGASVVREMSGIDGDLPETIDMVVPVYEEVFADDAAARRLYEGVNNNDAAAARHTETIELAVRVDLERRAFVFKPTGSSLRDAEVNARRIAAAKLRAGFGDGEGSIATVLEESAV